MTLTEQKTKAELLQELNTLRRRVTQLEQAESKKTAEELPESEQIFRTIFNDAADGILVADMESKKFRMANKAICQLLGYNSQEIKNLGVMDIHSEEDLPFVLEQFEKQARREFTLSKNIPVKKKDGHILYADINSFPVTLANKTYLMGIFRDITERKQAEEEIKASEENFRGLTDRMFDLLFMTDTQGYLTYISPASEKILNYKPDEMVGTHFKNYLIKSEIPRVSKRFAENTKGRNLGIFQMEAMRKDGSSVFIELNSSPIIKGGEIIGIQGVMRDMTERKKAEEELQKSEQKYRGLSESLDELVYRADPKTFAATYVNVAVKKLYGYSVKEWLADPGLWENSIHPNDKERTLRELEDAQRKLKSAIVEYRIIRKDKSVRYVKDHVSWEKDNEGKAVSMNGIMYDITDLKRFEQTICQSEEKYRTLVESTGDSIATVNEDGVFLYMNETGAKQLGGKPEDYIGKTMWNVFPKKIADRQVTNVQKVINTGEGINTVALTELHGQQRWYSTNIEPLRDGSRKVTAAMIVARDIHELKQAEEEIRNLSSAIEQTIDGIAIGDLGSKLLYVNDAFARMHGYTREEMIGMPITRLYKKEQMGEYRRGMNRIKTQDFWEGEIEHVRKDGAAFPTHMSVTLLRNNGGKPKGILAVARDITESKRREMALNIYRKKMTRTEQLASIGTLSATLAHELTQPLTVVRLSIENSLAELEKTSCPDTVVEDLKEGLSEVSSIASTVNGFRNLARRSSETKVTEVDLKAITKRIVKLLDENARLVKVTLRIEGMDKLPVIYSHKHELERLFYCLVENAIQAADGKKSHQVIISGALRDKQVELRFSDNCSGIALENLNKIFEPFFTTKSSTERTGLGLCVVEHILSRLDGKVRVESKLGKGSTFFVTLPINGVEK